MTNMATSVPFTIGSVFSRSWRVFISNLPTFFFLSLLIYAPLFVVDLAVVATREFTVTVVVIVLATVVLNYVVAAVIIHAAFQSLRSKAVRVGASFALAWSRIIPVLILAIVQSVLLVIGFMLLIIPGIFLLVILFVTMPSCVVERLDPFASLARSTELTKGHRWQLLGVLVFIFIISIVVTLLLAGILGEGSLGHDLVSWLWNILFSAFMSVMAVVAYHDLRVEKEGIDIEQIAAQFL